MKLTIGMATYDDFDGVCFSVQSLLLHQHCEDVEIIIIDNNPDSAHGKATRDFCSKVGSKRDQVRYIPMPESTGTTQPRQRVFEEAKGEFVLCMDAHVMFANFAIADLLDFFEAADDEQEDIYSGPILNDDRTIMATHFDPVWRSEMWGIWGYDARGEHPSNTPFETWGQGLGVFVCRKSAWLGFNPNFRGFGGEEGYIHEKFRQAGRKSICLPFLRWWHRFHRPAGIHYPRSIYQKVRNYVLGHQELGLSLAPIYEHFVASKLLPSDQWQYLLADPIKHEHAPGAYVQTKQQLLGPTPNLDELLIAVASNPRDLDQHAKLLRAFATQTPRIMAVVKRMEWNVILAAARPQRLRVWQKEAGPILDLVHKAVPLEHANPPRTYSTTISPSLDPSDIGQIEDCDLLVLDTEHSKLQLRRELDQYAGKVERRILIRGTGDFGETAEGGGEGQFAAIREWLKENAEWFVMLHETRQYGFTVLSKHPNDRPPHPVIPWKPHHGPGTELKKILKSLGIEPNAACGCAKKQAQMDEWGVQGCRDHFEEIVGWMREGQGRWGWRDKLTAAAKAVTTGLAFEIDWTDPFVGLVKVSIERAEQQETAA